MTPSQKPTAELTKFKNFAESAEDNWTENLLALADVIDERDRLRKALEEIKPLVQSIILSITLTSFGRKTGEATKKKIDKIIDAALLKSTQS
jgi:hypothetical protein